MKPTHILPISNSIIDIEDVKRMIYEYCDEEIISRNTPISFYTDFELEEKKCYAILFYAKN
jgi:hypothetical protein